MSKDPLLIRAHPELLDAHIAERMKEDHAYAAGINDQRTMSALRGAHRRKVNAQRSVEPLPALIDGLTGEVLDGGLDYREGTNVVRLPGGVAPTDVPPPACENNFAQVCRGLYGAARSHLDGKSIPHGAQLVWVDMLMAADPETGALDITGAEVSRRYGVSKSVGWTWLQKLAAEDLIEVVPATGRSSGRVTILNYATVVRLELRQRVEAAERAVRRRRVIEEEVTTKETTTRETTTRRRILEEVSDDVDLLR